VGGAERGRGAEGGAGEREGEGGGVFEHVPPLWHGPVRRRRSLLSYPGARLFHPLHVPAPAGPTGQEPPPPTCPPAGRSAPAFQLERAAFRHIRVDL
jgi:hypothetical protein